MGILSTVTGLNPYSLIAGGILIAGIGGTMYYQNNMIHYYHTAFDKEHDNFTAEHTIVQDMLTKQKDQTTKTGQNVTNVVTVPGPVKTIVKTIHDAPEPADCRTPPLSEDIKNAF